MTRIPGISDKAWTIIQRDSLDSLIHELVYVGDRDEECIQNLWWISLTSEDIKSVNQQDLVAFLKAIVENRRLQAQLLGIPMLFYAWQDEPAGTLCFSLISGTRHTVLPFRCTINPTLSLNTVVEKYFDGTKSKLSFSEEAFSAFESKDYVQDVFVELLTPRKEPTCKQHVRVCRDLDANVAIEA